ncbi:MAG TPA: orotate phosphoribosyltransferase [Gemmatimonadales bacterium]
MVEPLLADRQRQRLIELLRQRSVRTGQFTLASGRTSSYYVDARVTTMSAEGLELIGDLGLAAIRGAGWPANLVGGLTMGADPVSFAIARASRLAPPAIDAFSVRKDPREHGTGRRIEGCFRAGLPVVITEDVITTGNSAISALTAAREAGAQISGVLAVVDREEGGRAAIERTGVAVLVLALASELSIRG